MCYLLTHSITLAAAQSTEIEKLPSWQENWEDVDQQVDFAVQLEYVTLEENN